MRHVAATERNRTDEMTKGTTTTSVDDDDDERGRRMDTSWCGRDVRAARARFGCARSRGDDDEMSESRVVQNFVENLNGNAKRWAGFTEDGRACRGRVRREKCATMDVAMYLLDWRR